MIFLPMRFTSLVLSVALIPAAAHADSTTTSPAVAAAEPQVAEPATGAPHAATPPTEAPAAPAVAAEPRLRMSVEIDPADYTIYKGWGLFVGIRPEATGQWRFRLGGGTAELPDAVVQGNGNDGWHQKIDAVVTVAGHRYFGKGRSGFFAGGVAGWSNITFTAPSGGDVTVSNVVAGIDVGYRWFPSSKLGLVITPHFGALVPIYKSTEPQVGMEKFNLLPVIPNPQLLIGYELDVLK